MEAIDEDEIDEIREIADHDDEDKENRNVAIRRRVGDQSQSDRSSESTECELVRYKERGKGMSGLQSVTVSPSISCLDDVSDFNVDRDRHRDRNHNRNALRTPSIMPSDSILEHTQRGVVDPTPRRRIHFEDEVDEVVPRQSPLDGRWGMNDSAEFDVASNSEGADRMETESALSPLVGDGEGATNRGVHDDDHSMEDMNDAVDRVHHEVHGIERSEEPQVIAQNVAFRKHVLCALQRDKARTHSICTTFCVLFGVWIMPQCVYGVHDPFTVLIVIASMVMVLEDWRRCNGDGALTMLLMATFLVKKAMEFVIEGVEAMESGRGLLSNEHILDMFMVNGLLSVMIYLFLWDSTSLNANCHWKAIQEQVLNRGTVGRAFAFIVYFGTNGFLAMDLAAYWSALTLINAIWALLFLLFCVAVWVKLQDIRMFNIPQHRHVRLAEIFGFMVMMTALSAMLMIEDAGKCVIGDGVIDEKRVIMSVISLLTLRTV